jgi:hypothetical protein
MGIKMIKYFKSKKFKFTSPQPLSQGRGAITLIIYALSPPLSGRGGFRGRGI